MIPAGFDCHVSLIRIFTFMYDLADILLIWLYRFINKSIKNTNPDTNLYVTIRNQAGGV